MELILNVLLLIVFIFTVGWLCGRVLGVRLGRWQRIVVGAAGWVAGVLASVYVLGENGGLYVDDFGEVLGVIFVTLVFGMLAAMPIAIAIDLLTRRPEGKPRRKRKLLHPIRTTKAALAPTERDAFADPQALMQKELLRALPSLRTLPEHTEALANQLRAGRLTVRTERYVQETLWVLGFAGLGFAAALLMRSAAQALRRLPVREEDDW